MIGASQYTTQVSGSTIYVWPQEILPLRNVPVIAPEMQLEADEIDPAQIAASIKGVLKRLELADGEKPVAVFAPWRGSATFARWTRSAAASSRAFQACSRRATRSCWSATAMSAG